MNRRPLGPVVRPSKPLPESVAEMVERLVEENGAAIGADAWKRYEDAKRMLSEHCGPLAGPNCSQPVFQRALHAYMLGVCL